jgi:phosphoribosyl 1,2-cyclic phosphate phosphodiesterase
MTTLTFLGTGTSSGIPIIGCDCDICTSSDPRDKRTRTSAVVTHNDKTYLIDTATELRIQAIATGLKHIDAVLMTHAHADHVSGIDELRRFNELNQAHLPMYADEQTAAQLRDRYAYAFVDHFPFYGGKPDLILNVFDGPFTPFDDEIIPIPVPHGRSIVNGFRFDKLAYVTDAKEIPESSKVLLKGLGILVINALRERPHPTHLSLSEAVAVVEELKPRRAYLVHLSHELGHEQAAHQLPPGIEVAYDGLTVEVGAE